MRSTLRRIVQAGPGSVARRGIRSVIRRHVRMVAVAVVISLLLASLPATSGTKQVLARQDGARANTEAHVSFSTQLYHGFSQTLASLGSWLAGYGNSESATGRSTYYPVAALLTPPPFDAPTNLTVTAASGIGISLSWTAPAGSVDHYQIERSTSVLGPFFFLANTSSTTHNDTTVSNLQAYLYRVRAVASGGLPSAPSNMALGTAISFQFSNLLGQEIRAQHFHDVRTAINAARAVAGLPAATWTRANLAGLEVKADDVLELRTKLNEALTELDITLTGYQDATLNTGVNGTLIRAVHIEQLQMRSTRGSSNSSGPLDSDSSTARLDPLNETGGGGENPLSRNFNWILTLVSLSGRAGMNLGLKLSHNSLVWTRSGNIISFDDDGGFPSPGFRLGFPVIQPLYYNTEVGKYAYLLIGSDGSRTELRQVGASALFESADSGHLLLDTSPTLPAPDNDKFILRTSDGTRLLYALKGGVYQCTEIKDRNGNYITINYTAFDRIDTVVDTLARSIKFNYDANDRLISITQIWNQGLANEAPHNWATFEYSDTTIQTNFSGLTVFGPANNSTVKTLSKVTLADGSRFEFSYTSWGQVWKVSNFAADNHLLNYRSYNLPQTNTTAHTDCPRFTERRDWAQYWNGDTDGTAAANEEAVTAFTVPLSEIWDMPDNTSASGVRAQVTTPDGTINKIYFVGSAGTTSGWKRGLPALVETHSGGTWQRKVMSNWTQDDTTKSYPLNPRVTETNIYDPAGNRARTQITYQQFTYANGTSCHFPRDVYQYAADATTKLRSTQIDYHPSTVYSGRRILGLVSERRLYEGDVNGTLRSKVGFFYDNENGASSIQGTDAPVQHDNTHYTESFVTGRGNLSSVRRYDVTNTAQFTTTKTRYNTAGAVVSSKDALDHEVKISYADSFSDGNNSRNTLAYPKTVTDPDNYSSTTTYNFDFGAVTRRRTPLPNVTTNDPGPEQSFTFDLIGRLQQVTNLVNNAYTRFEYPTSQIRVDIYATIQDGLGEAHSIRITDGAGRVIATATDHNINLNTFSGQKMVYDVMGRVIKTSNPTETTASGAPSQWNSTGDDAGAGWIYTEQSYDWKGRPLVTTNQDGTTKTTSYAGCGCAGGEVVTLTDEGTIDAGITKKRQQKIYSDVLGRVWKTEVLNWDGTGPNGTAPNNTVYATTVTTFNARNQVMQVRRYVGPDTSSTFQETTMTYDGYGRLQTRHTPEQNAGTNTVWTYNADDTINTITDARGATATYGYAGTNRHLVKSISHTLSGSPTMTSTFEYDAAGNRTLITDGSGSTSYQYDSLSRLTSETRQFTGQGAPAGNFTLAYEYTLSGAVKKVTDERALTSFSTNYDAVGRISAVSAIGFGGANTTFVSSTQYRAWGAPKSVAYGNGTTLTAGYDNRLRLTDHVIAGLKMSWIAGMAPFSVGQTFQYYADGQLKFAARQHPSWVLGDPRTHNRAYEYDHAGRIREAYSGVEAHDFLGEPNSGVDQGPYRLSFTYDAWDNLLTGGGRYWSRGNVSSASFNNQNRDPNWEYDPDGRLISRNEPIDFPTAQPYRVNHDAAGQPVVSTQARAYFEPIIQQMVTASFTNSQTYDGDGQLIRYSKERTNSSNSPHHSLEVTFHLRSSVLGGAGISEYDGSGVWQRSHVYAGTNVVGEQGKSADGSQARSTFRHRNPLTGDEVDSRTNGDFGGESIIDPQGVNVAGSDPFPADGSGDPDGNVVPDPLVPAMSSEGLLMALGESGMKCVLDGIAVDCAFVGSTAVQCPENDCGPRLMERRDPNTNQFIDYVLSQPFQAWQDGYGGFLPRGASYEGEGRWRGGGTWEGQNPREGVTFNHASLLPQKRPPQTPCHIMADVAQGIANDAIRQNGDAKGALAQFDLEFSFLYHGPPLSSYENMKAAAPGTGRWLPPNHGYWIGGGGFRPQYQDSDPQLPPPDEHVQGPTSDQTHHFSAHLSLGINRRPFVNLWRNFSDNSGDARLGQAAYEIGRILSGSAERGRVTSLQNIGEYIRRNICTGSAGRGLEPGDWERLAWSFRQDLPRR